ncbi:hypothetical protein GOP47_0014726 [Adiantum capillus-veneris]|uniref:protein-serine/threonine phosphatase n=1 Tax=Adiantum capillus-veneris TaxID=13818 RepID=A0A9D4UN78_ADICA|nr:hypothetical protein GOP47_0014726 [Adiantum capillus-veneris]
MGMCMSMEGEEKREQKRLDKEMLSAEVKAMQLLAEMPGRLCFNGATKTCCLYTKQGCKGINQDSMLAWEGFAAEEESVFLGVFDGHGPNGHLVASKVRDCLPSLLTLPLESLLEGCSTPHHHIQKPIKMVDIDDSKIADHTYDIKLPGYVKDDEDLAWIEEKVTAAFHKMDERLKMHPKISCMSSGTTAVTILVQGKDLLVGSVGDSRAILATQSTDGSLVAHQLTMDLKPDSPGEIERIEKCQGRVFALEDEPHIPRLWLPHANTPGLAMARAFGDFCLKEYGLIATPQISHRKLTEEDEFIVVATDGVWDVLSNVEVMDAIASSSSKEEAAKSVVDAATNAWKRRNIASRMDDCAVVCHFLKDIKPGLSSKLDLSEKTKANDLKEEDTKHETDTSRQAETNRHLVRYDTLVTTVAELAEPESPLPSPHLDRGV